jgi:hypothetical protein
MPFRLPATIATFMVVSNCCVTALEPIDFDREIQPILSNHCYTCHGQDAEAREGGLRLDRRDDALVGGDDGPAFVPGNPDANYFEIHSSDAARTSDTDRHSCQYRGHNPTQIE